MDKDNILQSGVRDLFSLCEKRGCAVFSRFFDEAEQAQICDFADIGERALFFGGNLDCERKLLGVFPQWEEPDSEQFPICLISVTSAYKKELSHRDYLGSLMGLGIERDRIGDILVYDGSARVFVHESIGEYVLENLCKIGSLGVRTSRESISEFKYPLRRFEELGTVAASLRVDAVLAAALGLSRSAAAELIDRERVSVNHRVTLDASKRLSEGDLLSVRGFGRFLVGTVGNETRKGRIHVSVMKYI